MILGNISQIYFKKMTSVRMLKMFSRKCFRRKDLFCGKRTFLFLGLLTFWRNMRINSTSINTLKILTRLVNLVPSLEKSIESSQSVDSRFSVQLSASRKNNFQLPVKKSNIHYGKGLRTGEKLPRFSDEFNTIRHCPLSCWK